MDLVQLLPTIPFLSKLSPSELDALSKALLVDSFDDGHVFIREGERADAMHLVVEGEVTLGRERHGAWHEIQHGKPGDFFGLVAMLETDHHQPTCKAKGKVVVASMNRSVFAVVFGAHAPVSLAFQHALAGQLARDFRHLDAQIKEALASG